MAADRASGNRKRAPRVQFEHVTKHYPTPGGQPVVALDDVSLQIAPGRITVLVGSSGSGKTTLLRCVNRMVTPTSGRVLIDDADVAGLDAVQLRRTIGYVMQESGLLPHRRVIDNIATVPRLNGTSRRDAHARGLELMDMVGLNRSLATRYPGELSGGQQQRVGVARALAVSPTLLLMDEPFGAVDPIVRADLQTELRALQADLAATIIFVTHDISEALILGDHVVILAESGRIAQQGSGIELVAQPADQFVASFLGLDAERGLRVCEVAGVPVVVDASGRPIGRLNEPGERAAR
ncbi:MAG: ABC transporter ATP-binding protein [Brooklawnia sp.]|uniref:ABC transporter ATP-binding protein n=1 Tax=Brooklawnia sp. TaxID=2699740 RepID=UPI003C7520D8